METGVDIAKGAAIAAGVVLGEGKTGICIENV